MSLRSDISNFGLCPHVAISLRHRGDSIWPWLIYLCLAVLAMTHSDFCTQWCDPQRSKSLNELSSASTLLSYCLLSEIWPRLYDPGVCNHAMDKIYSTFCPKSLVVEQLSDVTSVLQPRKIKLYHGQTNPSTLPSYCLGYSEGFLLGIQSTVIESRYEQDILLFH